MDNVLDKLQDTNVLPMYVELSRFMVLTFLSEKQM